VPPLLRRGNRTRDDGRPASPLAIAFHRGPWLQTEIVWQAVAINDFASNFINVRRLPRRHPQWPQVQALPV
jgi:hypothetical protein